LKKPQIAPQRTKTAPSTRVFLLAAQQIRPGLTRVRDPSRMYLISGAGGLAWRQPVVAFVFRFGTSRADRFWPFSEVRERLLLQRTTRSGGPAGVSMYSPALAVPRWRSRQPRTKYVYSVPSIWGAVRRSRYAVSDLRPISITRDEAPGAACQALREAIRPSAGSA
jgi:hypothetical protein